MSYQLVSATGRERSLDARWETVDVSNQTLLTLFLQYQGLYLELTHYAYTHSIYLNLITLRDTIPVGDHHLTVTQWLAANGNTSLPTLNQLPDPRERHVKYNDAFLAGYQVDLINIGHAHDSQIPAGDKNDLMLRKSLVNFPSMWQYFLVSVNGFFHRSILGPDALYVLEGGRTKRLSNQNIIGLMSFREVAKTTQFAIKPEMISPMKTGRPLAEGVLLSLPTSLEGKTPLLVIGGFLHVLDSAYTVIGDRSIKISTATLNLADRYFHSLGKINLESVPVEHSPFSPRKTSVESLFTDETIRAYLSLPQSFVILVDTTDVYKRTHRVENNRLSGIYQQEGPFQRLPMFGTYGSILDYVAYREDDKYVYNAKPIHERHLNYRTTEWRFEHAIDDTEYSSRPWRLADGYLLEFGRFV